MGAVVREINGVKGFCEYKDGIPYTYIYTRDAIEMLGLVGHNRIKNTKFLRIKTFGEKYESVLKDEKVFNQPVKLGIVITPNFKISQVGFLNTTSCVQKANRIPSSIYDNIIPEYILDRVIFAIANKLHNETAESFRFELFNTIIPHFQQTATQDQIAKVPILNQTTQFMYDNTNYQLITRQSYNFAKQILDMHLNRLAVLRNDDNIDKIFITLLDELNNILKADQEFLTVDIALKEYIGFISKITGQDKPKSITFEDIKDAVILNTKIYTEFINFLIKNIRDEEEYLVMDSLNQERLVKYQPTSMSERTEYMRVPKDPSKIAVTRFYSLNERSGM